MAQMTKADLEALIKEIVGKTLTDIRAENKSWVNELFEAQRRATEGNAKAMAAGKGIRAAQFVRSLAAGRGDQGKAVDFAKIAFGESSDVTKALAETVFAAGGVLVPDEFVDEIIELLSGRAVVRSLGAISLPMEGGSLSMPRQTAGAQANYIGEMQRIPVSEERFGMLQLTAKELVAMVPISNNLLRDAARRSGTRVDEIVRNDLIQALALREDLAFIRGDGLNNTPRGLRNWAAALQINGATQAGAAATVAEVITDLARKMAEIEDAEVPMTRPGWIMNTRSKWYLMTLTNAAGTYWFKEEMEKGTLWGIPYKTTNQIPRNLVVGAANDTSEVYLADFSQCLIAENSDLEIAVSTEASYVDAQGQTISAFQQNQTLMKAITRHDFGVRHDQAISILTNVRWGA